MFKFRSSIGFWLGTPLGCSILFNDPVPPVIYLSLFSPAIYSTYISRLLSGLVRHNLLSPEFSQGILTAVSRTFFNWLKSWLVDFHQHYCVLLAVSVIARSYFWIYQFPVNTIHGSVSCHFSDALITVIGLVVSRGHRVPLVNPILSSAPFSQGVSLRSLDFAPRWTQ